MILAYLDQNIISRVANRTLKLTKGGPVQWIYSDEHFAEIKRSSQPEKYLDALDFLLAKKIKAGTLSSEISLAYEEGSAIELFSAYQQSITEVSFDTSTFNPLISWVAGGKCLEQLQEVPAKCFSEFYSLIDSLPVEVDSSDFKFIEIEFVNTIYAIGNWDNDINLTRTVLGFDKKKASNFEGGNVIQQLWEVVASNPEISKVVTRDQFFGFSPYPSEESQSLSVENSIIRCCMMLDVLGYYAESKVRNPNKVDNVLSDAKHIAAATNCHALISCDQRLLKRAKAIYEYLNIPTMPSMLETTSL